MLASNHVKEIQLEIATSLLGLKVDSTLVSVFTSPRAITMTRVAISATPVRLIKRYDYTYIKSIIRVRSAYFCINAIFCVIVGPKSRNNCSSTQWAYYSTNGRRRRRRRHINIFQMLMRKYWNQYWFLSEKYPEKNDGSSRNTKFWRNFR